MVIQWFGYSCVKLSAQQSETTVVIDPFGAQAGLKSPKHVADVVITSTVGELHDGGVDSVKVQGEELFVINAPGEYEVKTAFVVGVGVAEEGRPTTAVTVTHMDDLFVGHLGALHRVLTEKELDMIGRIDILFVPVGGGDVLTPKLAAEVVAQIDPRIVIPVYYAAGSESVTLEPLDAFLKAQGVAAPEVMDKLKIAKKDLPADETKVITLSLA